MSTNAAAATSSNDDVIEVIEQGEGEAGSPPRPSLLGSGFAKTMVGVASLSWLVLLPFMVVPWLPRKVFGALPWLPTSPKRVNLVLDALKPQFTTPGKVFVDLGSGDGVAVIEAAKRGMISRGVELNPSLVALSHLNALRAGTEVRRHTSFRLGNLFEEKISDCDVIMVFGVVPLMPRISEKIINEAKPDAVVISHKFPLPEREWGRHLHADLNAMLIYQRTARKSNKKDEGPLR